VGRAFAKLTAAQASTLTALLGPGRDATLAKLTGEERELFASAVHGLAIGMYEPLEYEAARLRSALFARCLRITVAVLLLAVLLGAAGTGWTGSTGNPTSRSIAPSP